MKPFIIAISLFLFWSSTSQKYDCSTKIKEYQDLYKLQKTKESFDVWSEVRLNCSKTNEEIFKDGISIYQFKIDNAKSNEEKEKLVSETLKLYDQYYTNFPLKTLDYEINKALLLINNTEKSPEQQQEIFTLLDNGFKHAATSVSSANAINIYYQMCFEKFKEKDSKFTLETILDKYNLLNGLLVQLQKTNHDKEVEYKTAQFSINNLTKEITTCENLSKYYEDKFGNNKENSDWLTNSLNSLSQNCANFPIYTQMSEANYKLKRTAQSAYFMGLVYTKQRKFTEAINYFKEAEELETDLFEKAKIDYSLATGLLANDYPKAKELLNRAISFNPSMGKAYLYLGTLYTNSTEECGKTEFDKKAIYYLAIQTIKKAILKEPKLKPAFEKTIQNYTPKSLKKEDIINQKLQGKNYTIGCWINETITFPLK